MGVIVVVGAALAVGVPLARAFARDAKGRAAAEERSGTYEAVVQDIIHLKGNRSHTKLFLRIETPEGPIGEYLIVPLAPPHDMSFLQDARATQRPILVRCCVDRSIEYALRQYAAVLGPA